MRTLIAGTWKKKNSSGFTLIELSVTLLILGLVLALVFPQFQDLTQVNLKSSARRLAGTFKYLHDKAASTSNLYRLSFDLKKDQYWVEVCKPTEANTCEWTEDTSTLGKKIQLPARIHFADIFLNGEQVMGDEANVLFLSQGFVVPTLVHIRDEREHFYSLLINPLTGRVKVYDKYIVEEKNEE